MRWCISSTMCNSIAKRCVYSSSTHSSWLFNSNTLSRIWQQGQQASSTTLNSTLTFNWWAPTGFGSSATQQKKLLFYISPLFNSCVLLLFTFPSLCLSSNRAHMNTSLNIHKHQNEHYLFPVTGLMIWIHLWNSDMWKKKSLWKIGNISLRLCFCWS